MKGELQFVSDKNAACRVTAKALLQAFRQDRFIFGYSAHFGDDLSARLLDLSDSINSAMSGRSVERKRLSFLLVEAYQNIIRHRAGMPKHIEEGEGRSFFFCRANPNGQDLVAINGVYKSRVEGIAAQLDAVRGLDHAELRELSMRLLQRPSEGRGGGVGFVEMTRRSGNDLGHMLRGLGSDHALFALAVRTGETHPHEKIICDAATLHGTVVMNDILLFHAGHMPPAVVDVIASMLRNDVDPTIDPAQAAQREERYRAWADLFGEISPARRCACVLACTATGPVLVQAVELDSGDADSALHVMMDRTVGSGTGVLGQGAPELTLDDADSRPVILVTLRV